MVHNSQLLQMMRESCLLEDSLMRVLIIGLTKELPLSPFDAMDIADKLVARAANAHTSGIYVCVPSKKLYMIVTCWCPHFNCVETLSFNKTHHFNVYLSFVLRFSDFTR